MFISLAEVGAILSGARKPVTDRDHVLWKFERMHESCAWYTIDIQSMTVSFGDAGLVVPGRIPAVGLCVSYTPIKRFFSDRICKQQHMNFVYGVNDVCYTRPRTGGWFDVVQVDGSQPSFNPSWTDFRKGAEAAIELLDMDMTGAFDEKKRQYYRNSMLRRLNRE